MKTDVALRISEFCSCCSRQEFFERCRRLQDRLSGKYGQDLFHVFPDCRRDWFLWIIFKRTPSLMTKHIWYRRLLDLRLQMQSLSREVLLRRVCERNEIVDWIYTLPGSLRFGRTKITCTHGTNNRQLGTLSRGSTCPSPIWRGRTRRAAARFHRGRPASAGLVGRAHVGGRYGAAL